jgi:hypothetical protein
MRAAKREQERREKEALERVMRDETERLEREKRDRMAGRSTSGVRGVRGTRASMRATGTAGRGVSRAGALYLYSVPWPCMLTSETTLLVASVSSTVMSGHTRAPSGMGPGSSRIAKPSSSVSSSARGTSIPRVISKRP